MGEIRARFRSIPSFPAHLIVGHMRKGSGAACALRCFIIPAEVIPPPRMTIVHRSSVLICFAIPGGTLPWPLQSGFRASAWIATPLLALALPPLQAARHPSFRSLSCRIHLGLGLTGGDWTPGNLKVC